jgi:threonine synthase
MEKIKYDPTKSYKWTPDDSFILSGGEFGTILNAFRAVLSSQEAQKIIAVERANDLLEGVLKKAVEDGIAVESNNE